MTAPMNMDVRSYQNSAPDPLRAAAAPSTTSAATRLPGVGHRCVQFAMKRKMTVVSLVVLSCLVMSFFSATTFADPLAMSADESAVLMRRTASTDDNNSHAPLKQGTCEATILLVRHCEKGFLKRHCDYIGLERSVYLATLFGDSPGPERWPTPAYIFAEGPGDRNHQSKRNYREIETVAPLSLKTGVPVDASFTSKTTKKLVAHLTKGLKKGDFCGKVVLVAWKHSQIGYLAHHLGCGTMQGCPGDYHGKSFDEVWQLRFVHDFAVSPGFGNHPKHHNTGSGWQVLGSVQPEAFDPLAFSKQLGDYPAGGRTGSSHWLPYAQVIPEMAVTRHGGDDWNEMKPNYVHTDTLEI
jgi:hypothetical protein